MDKTQQLLRKADLHLRGLTVHELMSRVDRILEAKQSRLCRKDSPEQKETKISLAMAASKRAAKKDGVEWWGDRRTKEKEILSEQTGITDPVVLNFMYYTLHEKNNCIPHRVW